MVICDRYYVMVNQITMATVKLSKWWLQVSTWPLGTLGSVASLLTATVYQGVHDRNHKQLAHEPNLLWVRVTRSLVLFMFCLFYSFFLWPLRCPLFTDSDFPFGSFKLFFLWVSSSCSPSGTWRVNLVTNPVISNKWERTRKCLQQVEHIYPDLHLEIESEKRLTTKLYDKGSDFKFPLWTL
jgi:hypothetical protein